MSDVKNIERRATCSDTNMETLLKVMTLSMDAQTQAYKAEIGKQVAGSAKVTITSAAVGLPTWVSHVSRAMCQ